MIQKNLLNTVFSKIVLYNKFIFHSCDRFCFPLFFLARIFHVKNQSYERKKWVYLSYSFNFEDKS